MLKLVRTHGNRHDQNSIFNSMHLVYYFGSMSCLILSLWAEKKSGHEQDLNVLYQVCVIFFRLIGKTKSPPGLWLAETFSTSPLNPLNGIQRNLTGIKISAFSTKCVFVWPTGKIQDGHPASDWLRYLRFLLRNSRTELNKTWLEASKPLPCLWFNGSIRKRDDCPDLTLADTFSTSLK